MGDVNILDEKLRAILVGCIDRWTDTRIEGFEDWMLDEDIEEIRYLFAQLTTERLIEELESLEISKPHHIATGYNVYDTDAMINRLQDRIATLRQELKE
jgi:hypothetical protein